MRGVSARLSRLKFGHVVATKRCRGSLELEKQDVSWRALVSLNMFTS